MTGTGTDPAQHGPVVTRFAPSPTGHLHIGGARTALFCWAFARRRRGVFLLRIEDTDRARSSESSARGILEDLAWLGIGWDEGPVLEADAALGGDPRGVGPFFQSQRLDLYNEVIEGMLDARTAYADFTPPGALEAARRAATEAKQTFRYRPADADILPPAEQRARMRAGEPHVVRLRAPEEPVRVMDEVLGEVAFAAGEVDDFVLRKADGFPTYHFGVVVDDEKMGVTHVLRGQEHLMNTPRHAMLQKVLGWRTPVYAHMPLIFNDQGAKMSKRERDQAARSAAKKAGLTEPPGGVLAPDEFRGWLSDTKRQLETDRLESLARAMGLSLPEVSVDDFRRAGYLPGVICNFVALLGWNPGMKNADGTDLERFDMGFLAERFDLSAIGKSNARFDRRKLLSFNGSTIGAMEDGAFLEAWLRWSERHDPACAGRLRGMEPGRALVLARAVRPRCKTLRDAAPAAAFAFIEDDRIVYDQGAVQKHLLGGSPDGASLLRGVLPALSSLPDWTPEAVQAAVEAFAERSGAGIGRVAQPLRVALTGGPVSPGLGETMVALGRESSLRRVERCIEYVQRPA